MLWLSCKIILFEFPNWTNISMESHIWVFSDSLCKRVAPLCPLNSPSPLQKKKKKKKNGYVTELQEIKKVNTHFLKP